VLTLTDHWLDQARRLDSPNAGDRPDPADISLIVVHNISLPPGEFGGPHIDELFTNRLDPDAHPYFASIAGLEVSSHFLICRDGAVRQYVACDRRAWHAGRSQWRGRDNCNDFAIGIELEGTDDMPYTDDQYWQLAALIHVLRRAYPAIAADAIVGHSDIAPGRKTDPGPAFDWTRLAGLLAAKEDTEQ
jgi:N-acetyl-anhydromuramoyl-L-alanine amidase